MKENKLGGFNVWREHANQFYVSISRGRKGVKVYTDSIDILRENVARESERKMATEIIQERSAEKLAVVTMPPVVTPVRQKAPEPQRAQNTPKRGLAKTADIQTVTPVKKREALELHME